MTRGLMRCLSSHDARFDQGPCVVSGGGLRKKGSKFSRFVVGEESRDRC